MIMKKLFITLLIVGVTSFAGYTLLSGEHNSSDNIVPETTQAEVLHRKIAPATIPPFKGHRLQTLIDFSHELNAILFNRELTAISDRLESRATYLGKTTGFDTLGKLCNILSSDTVLKDIIPQIVDWKNGRNRMLHEMSKIDASDMAEDFGEKYESGRLLAQSGLDIFRQVDAAVRRRQP